MRYKFIAYFPRGMDEIYFTEKVAARIFFLHSRWKSSRENERFCTKVSNVKFLFSRRNRQFFFFFFFFFLSLVRQNVNRQSYLLQFLLRNSILDRDLRSGPESAVVVIGMNGQIFSFPSFFFFLPFNKISLERIEGIEITFLWLSERWGNTPKIYSCKLEALFLIFQNIFFTN